MKNLKDVILSETKYSGSDYFDGFENDLYKAIPETFDNDIHLYKIEYWVNRETTREPQNYPGKIDRMVLVFTGQHRAHLKFMSPSKSSFSSIEKFINSYKPLKSIGIGVDKITFQFCCGISLDLDSNQNISKFDFKNIDILTKPLENRMGAVYHGETDALSINTTRKKITFMNTNITSNFKMYFFNESEQNVEVFLDSSCKYFRCNGIFCPKDGSNYNTTFKTDNKNVGLDLRKGPSWGWQEEVVIEPGTDLSKK